MREDGREICVKLRKIFQKNIGRLIINGKPNLTEFRTKIDPCIQTTKTIQDTTELFRIGTTRNFIEVFLFFFRV